MWVRRSEQEIAELRRPRWRWGWPLFAAVGLTSWLHDKTPFSSWELFLVLFPGFVLLARHFRVCAEPLLFNAYFTDDGDLVHYCADCRHIQSMDGEPRCAQCHGPTEPLEHYRGCRTRARSRRRRIRCFLNRSATPPYPAPPDDPGPDSVSEAQ